MVSFQGEKVVIFILRTADASLKGNMMKYLELIENYSGRDLTFEDDSLYAFAGIARHLARSKFHCFTCGVFRFRYQVCIDPGLLAIVNIC